MKEIIVEASPEGEVTVTVRGVKGKSCKDVTASFEKALGKTTSSVPTKEMYEKEQKQIQTVRQ